ncbi:MAG: acyloxyacyl hydrolase, partial [Muribaculaceae bacterium]|nr:acyloxyacyl hydrolase [Muribaculaceae bacterium]
LPIFSINAGIGRNIIANGPDTRIFYQTLALKAYVWQGAFLQVGYQLSNFHLPNNLMLGVGYTFGRKL